MHPQGRWRPALKVGTCVPEWAHPNIYIYCVGIIVSVPSYLAVLTWVCNVWIFSVQQDTCSSVIWGPAATGQWKSCYVASFRTLDSANNASQTLFSLAWNIMGDATDTSTRQRNEHAKDISLHALGIWSTHWVRITPDEMVWVAQRRVSQFTNFGPK